MVIHLHFITYLLLDLTKVFEIDVKHSSARLYVYNQDEKDNYYLHNIRCVVGKSDLRNKLLASGKYSTSEFIFNSGLADLRSESSATLKENAEVLNSQAGKSLPIIWYTDSDGNEEANFQLSEKGLSREGRFIGRASVKNKMATEVKG